MYLLCVDDDPAFLSIYKNVLEKNTLPDDQILLNADPAKSIEIIEENNIDIIITDLMMPEISGIDILKAIKKKNLRTEVIVVTGQGSIDSAVEAMRLGARDYITKPLNNGMLLEKIQNIREFIYREREAEEYRFAKETVENNAMKTINEMEIKLDGYIKLTYEIKSTIKEDIPGNDKLEKILNQINNVEKEM
jgi:DNA-binding NtrC family response regulator